MPASGKRPRSSKAADTVATAADLLSTFAELRPPAHAADAAENNIGAASANGLERIFETADGPMVVIASHLPSRGDALRLSFTSRTMMNQCQRSSAFRFLGLFRSGGVGAPLTSTLERHQRGSIEHMAAAENPPQWQFGELRGGVLADDPGLGKTVTMIAHIVATSGTRPRPPSEFWDVEAVRAGWEALRHNRVAKQQLVPLVNRLCGDFVRRGWQAVAFVNEDDPKGAYPTVESFEDAVYSTVRAVEAPAVKRELAEVARKALHTMRRGLDRRQRNFFQTSHGRRALLERELSPAASTLIVCPPPLLEHWAEQLRRHVDLAALSHRARVAGDGAAASATAALDVANGRGAVWIDGLGDLADAPFPLPTVSVTATPVASWIDLSEYPIVLTTFERCHREHSRADEHSAKHWAADDSRRSPLLSLRWLRLVVDEGHVLGGGENSSTGQIVDTDANKFISEIAAERRWVLSGTPTVGSNVKDALHQVHNLLRFLREPTYGLSPVSKWDRAVANVFASGAPSGRTALLNVLRPLMVRHTKADLRLPPPRYLPEWHGVVPWPPGATERAWVAATFRRAAVHIVERLREPRREAARGHGRPVKAVVFSRYINDLEQVGHGLYELEGDEAVAQHFGSFRSAELSRFRNSVTRYRVCPRCGFHNEQDMASGHKCARQLLIVKYDVAAPALAGGAGAGVQAGFVPGIQLHEPSDFERTWPVETERVYLRDNTSEQGWRPWAGQDFYRWQEMGPADKRVLVRGDLNVAGSALPRPGGGNAVCLLLGFARCGSYVGPARPHGRPPYEGCPPCWVQRGVPYTLHTPILHGVPWLTKEVETRLLLLCEDGSHGLDLSFVTHIFLVHRLRDPALLQQVVARAHRMGADPDRGVEVETLHLFDDTVEG